MDSLCHHHGKYFVLQAMRRLVMQQLSYYNNLTLCIETRSEGTGAATMVTAPEAKTTASSEGRRRRRRRSEQPQQQQQQQPQQPQPQQQQQQQRQYGIGRLAGCAAGICAFYLAYGVLQERLFTSTEMGPTFCLVTACLTNVAVALLWQRLSAVVDNRQDAGCDKKDDDDDKGSAESTQTALAATLDHRLFLITAGCYVISMAASNEAVPIVSYPSAVLAKSCKLVPTIAFGSLHRKYSTNQWIAALMITAGILLFQYTRIKIDGTDDNPNNKKHRSTTFGMALLWTSLLFDGLLGLCQDRLKHPALSPSSSSKRSLQQQQQQQQRQQHRPPTAVETMLWLNLYALLYMVPLAYAQNQIRLGLLREFIWSILAINAAAAGGQVFIFCTLAWYSPIITTTVTTTRKFVTILLSVWTFGHRFLPIQWFAVAIVFAGLYLAILEQRRTGGAGTTTKTPATAKRKHQ